MAKACWDVPLWVEILHLAGAQPLDATVAAALSAEMSKRPGTDIQGQGANGAKIAKTEDDVNGVSQVIGRLVGICHS